MKAASPTSALLLTVFLCEDEQTKKQLATESNRLEGTCDVSELLDSCWFVCEHTRHPRVPRINATARLISTVKKQTKIKPKQRSNCIQIIAVEEISGD